MKTLLLLIIALVCLGAVPHGTAAQGPAASVAIAAPDKMPEPVGGMMAISKLVNYPDAAKKENFQGTVMVRVKVGTDGRTEKTEIVQSVRADLDEAAVKALKQVKWLPAMQGGKAVAVEVVVPIKFKLEEKPK